MGDAALVRPWLTIGPVITHRDGLHMIFELTGKSALVTGAGSGIGAAIAETFARAGAHVFVTDVKLATASETAGRITSAGGTAMPLEMDVRDEAACVTRASDRAPRHPGEQRRHRPRGHGADHDGRRPRPPVRRQRPRHVERDEGYLPEMVAKHKGAIVNMASVAGLVGIQDRLAYATTKFAVVGLTKCMALDHAADGVRINCICPGRVETPWASARVREYPDPEKAYRDMAATQAMGRMGKPEEIAACGLYLASDEASFVTGSAFAIDGGWKG